MNYIIKKLSGAIKIDTDEIIPITDWPVNSNGQPYRKSECLWNGSEVVLKTDADLLQEYIANQFELLKEHIRLNWMEATKSQDLIRTQFNVYKSKSLNWIDESEVNKEIENFKNWMIG